MSIDTIRETSGKALPRDKLPISLDHKCLGHVRTNQDKELMFRLFKTACLAY